MKRIFIIEDEPDMLSLLKLLMEEENYEVVGFLRGEEALNLLNKSGEKLPDLVLLDLMLPGMSGYEICRNIKNNSATWNIPVLILTSRSDEFDMLTGFNLGADDYITKPFSEKLLVARVKTALSRSERSTDTNIIRFKNLLIDKEKYEVSIDDKIKNLTAAEFKTLVFLAENKAKVFTRDQIFAQIKEGYSDSTERSVDISIARIRKKLGSYSKYIQSVYGVGYVFKETLD
jgi:DNA-binding response OmpR family regulator